MKEDFLHYVWKHQYFNPRGLKTADGLPVTVYDPGTYNEDSGPDFLNARFSIEDVQWNGFVEIHLRSSDWLRHNHQQDENYDLVLLHVVHHHDRDIYRRDGSIIPTVEIGSLISREVYLRFHGLEPMADILCGNVLPVYRDKLQDNWLNELVRRRSQSRTCQILNDLEKADNDWNEVTFRRLSIAFGFKINEQGFKGIAETIPYKVIQKHLGSLFQIEALLLGAGGLLSMTAIDEYHFKLQQEYAFLSSKYRLSNLNSHPVNWNTVRARPKNFPTLRIAQLASVLYQRPSLFQSILEITDLKSACDFFITATSGYWNKHYFFGRKQKNPQIKLGKESMLNLVINSVIPLQNAWATFNGRNEDLSLLQMMPAEKNRITQRWSKYGINVNSAYESQALLELYTKQCQLKACLQCMIGKSIMES